MIEAPYLMVLVEALYEFEMQKKEYNKYYSTAYNRNFKFKSIGDAFQITQTNTLHLTEQKYRLYLEQILSENPLLFVLTPAYPSRLGAIWSKFPVNLNKSFTIQMWVSFIGAQGIHPADGLCFVLQNNGPDTIGNTGYDIGYGGIKGESLAIRLNTYYDENNQIGQHIRLCRNGDVNNVIGRLHPLPLREAITDSSFHEIAFTWNATTCAFSIIFDDKEITTYDIDFRVFFPCPKVQPIYWGITAATGECYSMQALYIQSIEVF